MFPTVTNLQISDNAVADLSLPLLTGYCISIFPALKAINSNSVTEEDRRQSDLWFSNIPKQQFKAADTGLSKKLIASMPSTDAAGVLNVGATVAADGALENNSSANAPAVVRANSTVPLATDTKTAEGGGGSFDFIFGSSQVSNYSRANTDLIAGVLLNRKLQETNFDEVLFDSYNKFQLPFDMIYLIFRHLRKPFTQYLKRA